MSADEPSWDLYRTLLAILAEGSLSGAARALGLTQPTVSRHVDQLEGALGRRLFVRTPRGLSPTEAARGIAPYAEAMAAAGAALRRTVVAADGAAVAGTVRVTASEVFAVERLPPVFAALRRRHPELAVEVVGTNAAQDLLRRDSDVAVRNFPPVQAVLVARRLGEAEIGLFATPGYLAERGVPPTLAALEEHDLVGFDQETPALRALSAAYPVLRRARFGFRADSDLAQMAATRAGFGIGVCQVGLAAGLVRVLPEAFALALPVWVVMHEDLRTSPRCRAVFDALVEGLGRQIKG